MVKKLIPIFVLLVLVTSIKASNELNFQFGYGVGIGRWLSGYPNFTGLVSTNDSITFKEYNDLYCSYGNGLKVHTDFVRYIRNTFGILFSIGYSGLGGYSTTYSLADSSNKLTVDFSMKSTYLHANVGIKIKIFSESKFSPFIYIAPGIFKAVVKGKEISVLSANRTQLSKEEFKREDFFKIGFSIKSGIGGIISLSEKIGLSAKISPTIAFSKRNKLTWINSESKVKTIHIFENDKAVLPKNEITNDGYIYYHHGQSNYSFSSVDFLVGLILKF